MINNAYEILYTSALVFIGVAILFALFRAIRGPRIADRIMAINMIGTLAIIALAVLANLLDQAYLLDVSLVYGLISFVAVTALTNIYVAVHLRKKASAEKKEGK